jgi:DNA-binding NarL/FixJ family response regulator
MNSISGAGIQVLLLDDDEFALDFMQVTLLDRYLEIEVQKRTDPDPTGEFDVYFLDDDFDGLRLAGRLARRVRAENPNAVILAFSASLDEATLKELLNAGCDGVCDKKVSSDLPKLLEVLDRCLLEIMEARNSPPEQLTGRYLLKTFRELFKEWNQRLDSQG